MLPLHQAYEVRTAVLEYIRATYHFKDPDVEREFHRFVCDDDTGLFRGPYISLKTPFVGADPAEQLPLDVLPPFTPHLHQVRAFQRLTTAGGHTPQPTLLTTGTGSGKTECFLYPVLDYVWRQNRNGRRPGVKVIIMYPMNALATDQAKRLAEVIYNDPRLRDVVTAGLFIGNSNDEKLHHDMGPDHIIEYRDAILNGQVPDILLTNFKMLDYALIRQDFMNLWQGNIGAESPQLRFLVLDELHTYDGAQGTDVANLIRRLKLKLHLKPGHLTPVGTSATIGNGSDSKKLLCNYATDVFGETFGEDSIIEEHRVTVGDFFGTTDLKPDLPPAELLKGLSRDTMKSADDYLHTALRVWLPELDGPDPEAIGSGLLKLKIARDILAATADGMKTMSELRQELGLRNEQYRKLMNSKMPDYGSIVVESLLALIAMAKAKGGRLPWVFLQVQLWQRELSGILRVVQKEPEFTWRDGQQHDERVSLPLYFCRDCGASGWITTRAETEHRYSAGPQAAVKAFMDKDPEVRLLNTCTESHRPIADYLGENTANEEEYINPADMTIVGKNDDDALHVVALRRGATHTEGGRLRFDCRCPLCLSDSLCLVGGKTSTLSSVGVSQIMSSDFDSSDPRGRKMLVFSNSVQDAAHLAGFYEVRTFRFLFRQSIQHFMKTVGHALSLSDLQKGFRDYWKAQLPDEEYYFRFIPGDLAEKVDLSRQYRDPVTRKLSDSFKSEFDLRVDWEICSEFGLNAQIGRTLEKMGSSATFFRRQDLELVFDVMKPWLEANNLGWLAERADLFLPFVNGFLHRLRVRGGIDHEFLRLFRTQQMNRVMLNWGRGGKKQHFLYKGFGGGMRTPQLIGTLPIKGRDDEYDVVTVRGTHYNWFYAYFLRSLAQPAATLSYDVERVNDFYLHLLQVLTDHGILDHKSATGIDNYAINPAALYVEPAVRQQKCEACESRLFVAKTDDLTEQTYCLDYKCGNRQYSTREAIGSNYYQRIYDRTLSPRIYSHEHTGLLDRDLREKIETDFKNRPNANSCNVLTATSTLEMGIDIGSLNVVVNSGIPPKPSNFMQRVGRAGRKEGAALVVNYAMGKKHDMYYYAEPKSMMEGAVSTPGCFLGARDILRRHFYAFCIDSWVSDSASNSVPAKIKGLGLTFEKLDTDSIFFNRVAAFAASHLDELEKGFRSQYPEAVQTVVDEVMSLARSGKIFQNVRDTFGQLMKTSDLIWKERSELAQRLKVIPESDKENRKALLARGRALKQRHIAIKESTPLEFMTDAGLLPNYAFPETGIKLSGSVFLDRAPGDDTPSPSLPKEIELVRPASQGIRELAPDNIFFTQKFRLPVNGLSLDNLSDGLKKFRYCSLCDALAEETTPEFADVACPKCGSESWQGNTHRFLSLKTATTDVHSNKSRMNDDRDERDFTIFNTMKHFRFAHSGAVTSYGLRKVGFGIEFCKNVTLTEVNYGNRMQRGSAIKVNEYETSEQGFVTCKYCGRTKSLINEYDEVRDFHFPFCSHRDVPYPADSGHADTWITSFLFRSMPTEAIKVLLPVQLFETQDSLQLFRAGLELGLRHYYGSNPEHLRIDAYREFNRLTKDFDNYLVIYDVIPGGTGYLSKLYNPQTFTELIRLSYEHIRDCQCHHEGKDGCYHCILTYGNQWQHTHLSRQRAEELFAELNSECGSWEAIEGSIGSLTQNGVIEESDLERQFVKAMERVAQSKAWKWQKVLDPLSESYSYALTILGEQTEIVYTVALQQSLGQAQGVAKATRPDFQFICQSATVDGNEIDPSGVPQWQVYLDGYRHHATEGQMGFYNDFERREAIRHSRYTTGKVRYSWTLTWSDIKHIVVEKEAEGYVGDDLYVKPDGLLDEDYPCTLCQRRDNLDRFLFMLEHPDRDVILREVYNYLVSCFSSPDNLVACDHIEEAVRENARTQYPPSQEDLEEGYFFAEIEIIPRTQLTSGTAWFQFDPSADQVYPELENGIRYNWGLKEGLTEIKQKDWEGFWRRYNLLQMFFEPKADEGASAAAEAVDLDEILLYFPGLEDVVTQLVENGVAFDTDGGFELTDSDGIVIAEAAIKIEGKNIVIDDFAGRADVAKVFRDNGYVVIDKSDFNINDIK